MEGFGLMKSFTALRLSGLLVAIALSPCLATTADAQTPRALDAWGASIAEVPVPHEGCFTASYPDTAWTETACVEAPKKPFLPRHGWANWTGTVGDGNDYEAVVTGTMTSSTGSFPTISGLKTETGSGGANDYSLQLNSNFMSGSPACAGASVPAKCLDWEQFVYSSGYTSGFMQYWLIYYDTKCPAGWYTYSYTYHHKKYTDCYKNSAAVSIPQEKISELAHMKLKGSAAKNGNDTFVLTVGYHAYSTSGKDKVVYLADGWNASEFNVIGDGGGSEANFNTGTTLTDEIFVANGTANAPTCMANAGTTGETNNLTLGTCTPFGGSKPWISFTESN